MKLALIDHPQTLTVMLFSISIIMLAYIVRVFEMPYDLKTDKTDFLDFGDSIWFTIITITTVGYGDIVCKTMGGQLTAIFIALWGTFIVSLLVLVAGSIFELKPEEVKAVRQAK